MINDGDFLLKLKISSCVKSLHLPVFLRGLISAKTLTIIGSKKDPISAFDYASPDLHLYLKVSSHSHLNNHFKPNSYLLLSLILSYF